MTGSQIIGISIQIAVYFIVDAAFDPPITWSATIMTLCNKKAGQAYHHESFKAIGYTFAAYGAYWGLFVQQKVFSGQLEISSPHRLSILKLFGRLGVAIVLVVPWAAILVFV